MFVFLSSSFDVVILSRICSFYPQISPEYRNHSNRMRQGKRRRPRPGAEMEFITGAGNESSSPYLRKIGPNMEKGCRAVVIMAYDVTRDLNKHELELAIRDALTRGDILHKGDMLLVLGVLHTVPNPMGIQTKACTNSFMGTNARVIEEEVSKKLDKYAGMLLKSAEQCEDAGVSVQVKIIAGTPTRRVILQEVVSCKPSWVIVDRHLRRDTKFYEKHIPCKVALIQDSLSLKKLKTDLTDIVTTDISEHRYLYSLAMFVEPNISVQQAANNEPSVNSVGSFNAFLSSQDSSAALKCNPPSTGQEHVDSHILLADWVGSSSKQGTIRKFTREEKNISDPQRFPNQHGTHFQYDSSEKPILCAGCGLRSALHVKESMKFNFSEIQNATSNFSSEKLLGEGGFGRVYKGTLKDGQTIAAKLRKETSNQGYSEFFSEVQVLSVARHKNIVMLLGYCCNENSNILVYEFICNNSLAWHLFSGSASLLEWHKRYAIAVWTAKGLRYLHEECRGGPIIHRDLRPSNILLTHDFVPMLADFGLAKSKSTNDPFYTRIVGTSGYLAPEYAENGILSVRTDVYAFGIILFQLISGKKVFEVKSERQYDHLLHWVC